ncbi:MAG: helix-turn-helix transcriptional regulator, partial [Ruminococcaceae bacterium]|nr:helix-turn-helix transcriptional regulator [Oscillospiraceae bacterium]
GKTYTELLNAVRMEKACQMLVQTELPAGEIAVTIGYGTVKHFYRVFREMIGMTPQQYRKSHTCEL